MTKNTFTKKTGLQLRIYRHWIIIFLIILIPFLILNMKFDLPSFVKFLFYFSLTTILIRVLRNFRNEITKIEVDKNEVRFHRRFKKVKKVKHKNLRFGENKNFINIGYKKRPFLGGSSFSWVYVYDNEWENKKGLLEKLRETSILDQSNDKPPPTMRTEDVIGDIFGL